MEHQNTQPSSTVEEVISLFSHAPLGTIDPRTLFAGLAACNDNDLRQLREWALSKGCNARAFGGAARDWRLKQELGRVPETSCEFVAAFAASKKITADCNGMLCKPTHGSIFVSDYNGADLERDAILANERLRAGFDKSLIRLAIDAWIAEARPARLTEIWASINDTTAPPADDQWERFCRAWIDTDQVTIGYATAVFKKFVWQVKRKMLGMAVTDHLMPVATGPQGNGKTTAITKMLEPVKGMERKVSFSEITDVRNLDMWRSFVLFTDEMEKAQKADVEAIKGVITASTLDRRFLGGMKMGQVTQNATFIGAANSALGANIRDVSGLRRFAPCPTLGRPGHSDRAVDWEVINAADFGAMWRSVQVTDPDPMIPHRAELDRLQEEEREKGAVELWLDSLDPSSHRLLREGAERGIRAEELYNLFKDFEDENIRSSIKTALPVWGREMKRLVDLSPGDAKFTRKRTGGGMRFVPTERLLGSCDNIIALRSTN